MSSSRNALSVNRSHLPQDASGSAIRHLLRESPIPLSNSIAWDDAETKRCLHESWISRLPIDITLRREQTRDIIRATYEVAREAFAPEDGDEIDTALKSAQSQCLSNEDSISSFNNSLLWGVGLEFNTSLIRAKKAEETDFRTRLGEVSDKDFKQLKQEAGRSMTVKDWVPRQSEYYQTTLHARIVEILRERGSLNTRTDSRMADE